jgi:hypothetical protein
MMRYTACGTGCGHSVPYVHARVLTCTWPTQCTRSAREVENLHGGKLVTIKLMTEQVAAG